MCFLSTKCSIKSEDFLFKGINVVPKKQKFKKIYAALLVKCAGARSNRIPEYFKDYFDFFMYFYVNKYMILIFLGQILCISTLHLII